MYVPYEDEFEGLLDDEEKTIEAPDYEYELCNLDSFYDSGSEDIDRITSHFL